MYCEITTNAYLHIGVLDTLMPQQKLEVVCVIMAHITRKLGIAVAHLMSPQMSQSDCRKVTLLA